MSACETTATIVVNEKAYTLTDRAALLALYLITHQDKINGLRVGHLTFDCGVDSVKLTLSEVAEPIRLRR